MGNRNAVLVLDVDFLPLRIEDWKKVFRGMLLGKVEVIKYSDDQTIRGVSRSYPMPSLVRVLTRFNRAKQAIKFSRLNIYARDWFTCQYCRKRFMTEELTFDHVVPRTKGGRTSWENIVTCCVPCNRSKGGRTPAEAGMRLHKTPRKPRYLPAITVDMIPRPEWQEYWRVPLEP